MTSCGNCSPLPPPSSCYHDHHSCCDPWHGGGGSYRALSYDKSGDGGLNKDEFKASISNYVQDNGTINEWGLSNYLETFGYSCKEASMYASALMGKSKEMDPFAVASKLDFNKSGIIGITDGEADYALSKLEPNPATFL
jgi:hypothetical protein